MRDVNWGTGYPQMTAMRDMAHVLQSMGLSFAFSSKTAQARYEGRSPPEDIHVAIFTREDDKALDQQAAVKQIAEAARDRHIILSLDSQLLYTAADGAEHLREGHHSGRFVVSITRWQPQACDIRYVDYLPYTSPLFLLMSRLESSNSVTPQDRDKITKLLAFVQAWHTTAGEVIGVSTFSRFPRSLENAKELCRQFPSLGNNFLQMGVDILSFHPVTAGSQDAEVEASLELEVARQAAVSAVSVLQNLGVHCALFGGMAGYLYGNPRVPKDVDILALPQRREADAKVTAEEIKKMIVQKDPEHFFLRDARDQTSSYKILWYRRPLGISCSIHECKVDIVLPGVLHLPNLRLDQIRVDGLERLPVVPFSLLLLQKLQAWDDRVNADEPYKRARQVIDSSDVEALLRVPHVVSLRFSRPWNDESLFDKEFQAKTKERVRKFCIAFPSQTQSWRLLGFEV